MPLIRPIYTVFHPKRYLKLLKATIINYTTDFGSLQFFFCVSPSRFLLNISQFIILYKSLKGYKIHLVDSYFAFNVPRLCCS